MIDRHFWIAPCFADGSEMSRVDSAAIVAVASDILFYMASLGRTCDCNQGRAEKSGKVKVKVSSSSTIG